MGYKFVVHSAYATPKMQPSRYGVTQENATVVKAFDWIVQANLERTLSKRGSLYYGEAIM